jgi:hypothetical protein
MLKNYINSNLGDVIFNRNSYRRFIYIAFILLIIDYAIVALLYNQLISIRVPPNFATTSDGRIINITPS